MRLKHSGVCEESKGPKRKYHEACGHLMSYFSGRAGAVVRVRLSLHDLMSDLCSSLRFLRQGSWNHSFSLAGSCVAKCLARTLRAFGHFVRKNFRTALVFRGEMVWMSESPHCHNSQSLPSCLSG